MSLLIIAVSFFFILFALQELFGQEGIAYGFVGFGLIFLFLLFA